MHKLMSRNDCARNEPAGAADASSSARRIVTRAVVMAFVLVALSAVSAMAQIYVVEQPDGTRRFTNEPVAGAKIFIQTRYSGRAEPVRRGGPIPFQQEITTASSQAGVDARLVEAVIAAESAFDPRAISKKGAQGLMQLMPATADRYGVTNVWDPLQNIVGGTTHLRDLIQTYHGDLRNVLAAYNAGEGAVAKHGGVPPYQETREYIDRVLEYYRRVGGQTSIASRIR